MLSRAAEEELMEVAGERDKMAPQLQELAWQNRNLERQVDQLSKDSQQASQVMSALAPTVGQPSLPCCLSSQIFLLKGISTERT